MHNQSHASAATLPTLPFEQRRWQLRYANDDGTIGATACPINYDEVYNLKGRLLTLVDATLVDPQQRKAFKDLVWQTLRQWYEDVERDCTWQPAQDDDTAASEGNGYLAGKAR
jgi:hypothetical protein